MPQSTSRELVMRKASDALELCPALYCRVMTYRLGKQRAYNRVVHPQTDITIEGFPRCANSFAVQAFRSANDVNEPLRIATHLHSTANVVHSIRLKIPTVVLIRNPRNALVSWLSLAIQLNKVSETSRTDRNQLRRMTYWTKRYASFYERLMPYRTAMVCFDFNEVVTDFGACIERIIQHFSTEFHLFRHTEAQVDEVFQRSKVHLSPSVDREQIKQQVNAYYFSTANSVNRKIAQAMYQAFKD